MKIGEKIKLIRIYEKLSQKEFSNRLGISRYIVSNMETNKVTTPKLHRTCIAAVFNIDKDWLLDDDDERVDIPFLPARHVDYEMMTPTEKQILLKNLSKDIYKIDDEILLYYSQLKKSNKVFMFDMLKSYIEKRDS